MDKEAMLLGYEAIVEISNEMRLSAKFGDWGRLSELEQLCKKQAELAHAWKQLGPLSGQAIARKVASLNAIMANDKAIREQLEPWQNTLMAIMRSKQKMQPIPATDYSNI